jgi:hypothetical protein
VKRITSLAFAIMLIASFFPSPAAGAADNKGPACADIKGRGGSFYKVVPDPGPTGTAEFYFEFFIAAAPCTFATYFLYVTDSSGGAVSTATYPATAGNDTLILCVPTKFCYDATLGATPGGAPTPIFVTGVSNIQGHVADTTPTVDYVLCDNNVNDTTYESPCGSGDNSWDQ